MEKALIIIAIIIAVLAAAILGFLYYMGMFSPLVIEEKEMGPYTYAYVEFTGPYHEIGPSMMELDEKMRAAGFNSTDGIGIFYDDPAQTPAEELRSDVGSIITDADMSLIEENQDNFNFVTLEKRNYLVAEFPIKNMASYMLGPMKVYAEFGKYLEEQGIAVPTKGIEIYDMTNNVILYMMEYNN